LTEERTSEVLPSLASADDLIADAGRWTTVRPKSRQLLPAAIYDTI